MCPVTGVSFYIPSAVWNILACLKWMFWFWQLCFLSSSFPAAAAAADSCFHSFKPLIYQLYQQTEWANSLWTWRCIWRLRSQTCSSRSGGNRATEKLDLNSSGGQKKQKDSRGMLSLLDVWISIFWMSFHYLHVLNSSYIQVRVALYQL